MPSGRYDTRPADGQWQGSLTVETPAVPQSRSTPHSMAIPIPVKLRCPLCSASFQARAMGSSYFIAGVDTDLRETGSIEDVRRFSVATCPTCRYSDYSWDFDPED